MLNIVKYLIKELKKFSPRTYNMRATKDAIFPYVVVNLRTSTISEKNREDVILEVDIWDYARDSYDAFVTVEELTNRIDKFLKDNRHIDNNQLLIFQKINRLTLPDEDENIERRQLRYVVKYYDRNQ